jgi:hypothetical protein
MWKIIRAVFWQTIFLLFVVNGSLMCAICYPHSMHKSKSNGTSQHRSVRYNTSFKNFLVQCEVFYGGCWNDAHNLDFHGMKWCLFRFERKTYCLRHQGGGIGQGRWSDMVEENIPVIQEGLRKPGKSELRSYGVTKKSLCTWWLQYKKYAEIF